MVDMCLNDYLYKNNVLDETLVALLVNWLHTCLIEISLHLNCLFVKFPLNECWLILINSRTHVRMYNEFHVVILYVIMRIYDILT